MTKTRKNENTNNDLQSTTRKIQNRATRTSLKLRVNLVVEIATKKIRDDE